jgi:hypothetical protein
MSWHGAIGLSVATFLGRTYLRSCLPQDESVRIRPRYQREILPISNASALLNEPEAFFFLQGGHYVEGD